MTTKLSSRVRQPRLFYFTYVFNTEMRIYTKYVLQSYSHIKRIFKRGAEGAGRGKTICYNFLMAQKPRVLVTGGGSGGHIYPLLAVVQKLRGIDVRYVGAPGSYAPLLENAGIKVSVIVSSKIRRYLSFLNIIDLFKFIIGFKQSLWHLYWQMPDVLFSKGGPGALPVVLAARCYFIPVIIHESDAMPSLTAKISAKFASIIDCAFSAAAQYFPKEKTEVVGQPVRETILLERDRESAIASFGMNDAAPILLVLGGSQGAEKINEFTLANVEELLDSFQIIHQVGPHLYEQYRREFDFISSGFSDALMRRYYFVPFLEQNILDALTAADVVVSRAGAGAIFEAAAKGKPSVLIPLPGSANGHQNANAYEYERAGACVVIEQENLLPHLFVSVIEDILKDAEKLRKMQNAARAFFIPNAADIIANQIKSFTV